MSRCARETLQWASHKDAVEGVKLRDHAGAKIGSIDQVRLRKMIEAVQG
jgi:hypothetical protein